IEPVFGVTFAPVKLSSGFRSHPVGPLPPSARLVTAPLLSFSTHSSSSILGEKINQVEPTSRRLEHARGNANELQTAVSSGTVDFSAPYTITLEQGAEERVLNHASRDGAGGETVLRPPPEGGAVHRFLPRLRHRGGAHDRALDAPPGRHPDGGPDGGRRRGGRRRSDRAQEGELLRGFCDRFPVARAGHRRQQLLPRP
ncbi:unnamed protein product, partial [Scytosiphon promiscuus]